MFVFTAVCAAVNSTSPEFFASDKPRSFLDSQVWCEQHNASLARIDSLENEVEARKVIFQYLKHFHEAPGEATWDPMFSLWDYDRGYPDSLGFWIGVVRPTPETAIPEILTHGFSDPASFADFYDHSFSIHYGLSNYPWLSKAPLVGGKWVSKHDSWYAFAWYDDTDSKYWEYIDTNGCMSWSCVYATPYNWLNGKNCDREEKMALCERDALPNIPDGEMARFLTKTKPCSTQAISESNKLWDRSNTYWVEQGYSEYEKSARLMSYFELSVQMVIFVIAVLRFVLLVTISLRQIRKLKEEGETVRVANDWNSPLATRVDIISGTYIATDIRNTTWSALIRTFVPAGALLMLDFDSPRWPEENFLATMIALMYFAAQNAGMSAAVKAEVLSDYDAKIPAQQSDMEGPKDWVEYILAVYASWAVIFAVYLGSLGVATWGIAKDSIYWDGVSGFHLGRYCFYLGLPFGSALIASVIATFLKWKGTCSNAIKAYRNLASNIADGTMPLLTESPVQSPTATIPDGNMRRAVFIPEFLVVIAYVTLSTVFCLLALDVYSALYLLAMFWTGILGLVFIWGLVTAIVSVAWYRCARNPRLDMPSVSPLLRNEDAGTELTQVAVTPIAPSTSNSSALPSEKALGKMPAVAVTPSAPSTSRTTHRSHDQPDAAVQPQFDEHARARRCNKIEQLDRQHKIIVELVESINSIFTIPLLVLIIIFAILGLFERSLTLSVSYFAVALGVVAIAASLGDDYTEAKAYVLGPDVSRSLAKLMQDNPEQYSAYRDGLKQSLLGVQLFNLVVTTPRLLSTAFGLAFIKTAFEILKSLGFMSSEHA